METTIQISEVNSKDVMTPRGASTVYNVKSTDGREFSTFKKPFADVASQLRGQFAVVEYRAVEKPSKDGTKTFINYYLDGIKPAEGLTESPDAPRGTNPQIDALGNVSFRGAGVTHNITPKQDDRSAQINRAVAFKAAVELVGAGVRAIYGLGDLDTLTNKLIPIVDGTYVSAPKVADPFEGLSSGENGSGPDKVLVDF